MTERWDDTIPPGVARVLLGFAVRQHAAAVDADDAVVALEHRLATFFFAYGGFQARINEAYQQRLHQGRVHADQEWRHRTPERRLEALLGAREMSRRRRRLLRDVDEMWDSVTRPAALRVVKQMALDTPPDGPDRGGVRVLLETGPAYREERYRPAALPADVLSFEERHLRTCLLVMTEHLVLIERRFHPQPPLHVRTDAGPMDIGDWFEALRDGYTGPHAAFFDRIRLPR
ncbi:MAG TPA: hypothetical protein VJ957_12080 [Longimicrobiales bacterium]|nr:hypothetical protein [Longimicrobiales bacterium]